MRLPLAIRIPIFLVVVLATASIVSSLSIPRKLDGELVLVDLAKRAAAKDDPQPSPTAKDAKDPPPPPPKEVAHKNPPASTPVASKPPIATPVAVASSSAVASKAISSAPRSSAPSSSDADMSSVPLFINRTATQTGVNANATATNSAAAVPTGGLSGPAIGGIAALGGVAVVGAAIFAVMRYKRKASLTQNLGNKTNNQYANNSPYGGASFPSGANTGYERLSDPQISGAMAPVVSSPTQQQQSLGTYNVISTYTPTLGDELEIQPGDKVTLLVEYDDGWCQGVNESRGRVKGVFPKHCVDLGGGQGDMSGSKRVSSMYGAGGYRM